MSKKKIFAIIVFIVLSLFMFSFANPAEIDLGPGNEQTEIDKKGLKDAIDRGNEIIDNHGTNSDLLKELEEAIQNGEDVYEGESTQKEVDDAKEKIEEAIEKFEDDIMNRATIGLVPSTLAESTFVDMITTVKIDDKKYIESVKFVVGTNCYANGINLWLNANSQAFSRVTANTTYTSCLFLTNGAVKHATVTINNIKAEEPDTEAPVISLNGNEEIKIVLGKTTYEDELAKVIDNIDEEREIAGEVVGTTDEVGTYEIKYNATDEAGNEAEEVVRTVKVLDPSEDEDNDGFSNEEEVDSETDFDDPESHPETYMPTISLLGENPYIMLQNTEYVEAGVEITVDSHDTETTVEDVETETDLDVETVGTYTVTYKITDKYGKEATVERKVLVLDPNGDEDGDGFTNEEEMENPKEPTDSTKPEGEDNPLIETEPTNPEDKEDHPETYMPTISLLGENPYVMLQNQEYVEAGVEITVDSHDTETTVEDVVTETDLDVETVGIYTITYKITDKYGKEATVERKVLVLDPNGDEDGDGFTNEEEMENPKEPTDSTKPEGEDNPLVGAEPTNPEDEEDHPETYMPTISLLGENPYVMLQNQEYVEAGVEITVDSHDTETTVEDVETETDLDVETVGIYTVTYKITDKYGKEATVERKVLVLDPNGDEDGDGFTNEEEMENPKEPTDPTKPEGEDNPLVDAEPTNPEDEEDHPETYMPTISLLGENPYVMLQNQEYVEAGVEITVDSHDTETTVEDVETETDLDVETVGIYTITYKITDKYGKEATVERTVKVLEPTEDEDGDGFTNEEEMENPEEPTDPTKPEGEDNPLIETEPTNPEAKEDHPETYAPTISLLGENPHAMLQNTEYVEAGVEITVDSHDTETTVEDVETETDLDVETVGTYTVTYKVTDKYGKEATVERIVRVLDPNGDEDEDGYTNKEEIDDEKNPLDEEEHPEYDNRPTITFGENNIYEMTVYDEIPTFTAIATDVADGEVEVVITNDIDPNEVGTYTVTFKAVDSLGNERVETKAFKVNVREITVEIENKTSVYGSELEELTYVVTSGTEVETNKAGISLTKEEGLNAGSYAITGTYTNTNYNVTLVNGTYIVTEKTLTEEDLEELGITFENKTVTYNGQSQEVTVSTLPVGFTVEYTNNNGTNVDTYNATAVITGNANYAGTVTLNATLVINPKEVAVTWGETEFTYNGNPQKPSATIDTGIENETLTLTVSGEQTNVGENYVATATIDPENGNYVLTNTTTTFAIATKELTENDLANVVFENATFTYDGTEKIIEVLNLPEDFTVVYDENVRTVVGTQTVTATITGNANYTGTVEIKATLTIEKANVTVTADNKTTVYGEELAELTSTVTGTVYGTDSLNIELSKEEGISVGTYEITVSASNTNYNITLVNGTYTVTEKTLSEEDLEKLGIIFENETVTYNGEEQEVTVSTLPEGFTVEYTNNNGTNVDIYNATAVITGNANYAGTVTLNATLTINPANVTVTADNKTSVYGSELTELTSTITGTVYGTDSLNIELSKEEGTNVGTYEITVSASNANYNITLVNGTYTVTEKTLTEEDLEELGITFENKTVTYNGQPQQVIVSNLPEGFTVEYSENTRTNVGSQTATATIKGNSDYSGVVVLTATLTINPANVTVTADNKTTVYGEELAELTSTITGTVYGTDSLNVVLTKEVGTDVGTYAITVSANNANYNITLVNGTYKITTQTITEETLANIPFNSATYTYDGTEKVLEVTGLPAGIEVTYTNNKGTNVGTYNAVATITGTGNYAGTVTKNAILTINPANVTVTADNKTSVYGSELAELTSTVTGTVYEADSLNIQLSKEEGIDVGTYEITVSASNANYNITLVNGTYTITAKPLENEELLSGVTFNNTTFTYDGTEKEIEVSNLPVGFSVTYDDNTRTNAGSQTVTAIITGTGNYSGTITKTAELAIEKANITVTADNKTSVYGEELAELTSTIAGTVYEADTLNIELAKAEGLTVGTYTITVSASNANYNITLVNGTYTITKATYDMSNVTFNDNTFTYDNTAKSLEITGELPEGVTVSYENNSQTNAGTYTVTAKFTSSDSNYNGIADMTATLTIEKANPTVPTVENLIAIKGDLVNTVELPEGFTYVDETLVLNTAGNVEVDVIYTPTDTDNYNTVDTTVTIYVKDIYTVVFKNEETELKTEQVIEGESATAPETNPSKTDYTFTGWDKEFTNVTSDLTVNAVFTANQTGIRVEPKPNTQLLFQLNSNINISEFINVYNVYADNTESLTTNYTTNFATTSLGTKTLTVTQNTYTDSSLEYSIITDEISQTKFEVIMPEGNTYRKTKSDSCSTNCNSEANTTEVTVDYDFVEIIEHYEELIEVTGVTVIHSTEPTTEVLTNFDNTVRWTRQTSSGWSYRTHSPVRIAQVRDKETIVELHITYEKTIEAEYFWQNKTETWVVKLYYNSTTGEFVAYSEERISVK